MARPTLHRVMTISRTLPEAERPWRRRSFDLTCVRSDGRVIADFSGIVKCLMQVPLSSCSQAASPRAARWIEPKCPRDQAKIPLTFALTFARLEPAFRPAR
jgi:hypothetical protein